MRSSIGRSLAAEIVRRWWIVFTGATIGVLLATVTQSSLREDELRIYLGDPVAVSLTESILQTSVEIPRPDRSKVIDAVKTEEFAESLKKRWPSGKIDIAPAGSNDILIRLRSKSKEVNRATATLLESEVRRIRRDGLETAVAEIGSVINDELRGIDQKVESLTQQLDGASSTDQRSRSLADERTYLVKRRTEILSRNSAFNRQVTENLDGVDVSFVEDSRPDSSPNLSVYSFCAAVGALLALAFVVTRSRTLKAANSRQDISLIAGDQAIISVVAESDISNSSLARAIERVETKLGGNVRFIPVVGDAPSRSASERVADLLSPSKPDAINDVLVIVIDGAKPPEKHSLGRTLVECKDAGEAVAGIVIVCESEGQKEQWY